MLGCKYIGSTQEAFKHLELIDTCWDVNFITVSASPLDVGELIDTCWDVNVSMYNISIL